MKIVIKENVLPMNGEKMNYIQPSSLAIDKDILYCVDKVSWQIIVVNLLEKKIERMVALPPGITFMDGCRTLLFLYKEKIFFSPNTESAIYILEKGNKTWKKCELFETPQKGYYLFSVGRILDRYLYLFPFTGRRYYKLDLEQGSVEAYCDISRSLEIKFSEKIQSLNAPAWLDNRHVVGGISKNNAVFVFDVENNGVTYNSFDIEDCVISTVASVGDSLILCDKGNGILYRASKQSMNIDKEYRLKSKMARVTSLNAKLFAVVYFDTCDFSILDESFKTIYEKTDRSKGKAISADGSGIVIYGDRTGAYYDKFSKCVYFFVDERMTEETDILKTLEISSEIGHEEAEGRVFVEDMFFALNDFVNVI